MTEFIGTVVSFERGGFAPRQIHSILTELGEKLVQMGVLSKSAKANIP
jgi:hypothetical protein